MCVTSYNVIFFNQSEEVVGGGEAFETCSPSRQLPNSFVFERIYQGIFLVFSCISHKLRCLPMKV